MHLAVYGLMCLCFVPCLDGSPLLSALVILSVIVILGVSAVVWFFHQRNNSGSPLLPSFEYHPPFRAPSADQTCLVEAEELEETS